MHDVVQISKKNGVSIGAHPSFNDPKNFGLGYRLRAVRDDPQAALSLCINVSNYKIIAYVISAMIMAPMGSLFAQYILIIDPDRVFNIEISIIVLLITVLGGIGKYYAFFYQDS